jgi:hypothetical protein
VRGAVQVTVRHRRQEAEVEASPTSAGDSAGPSLSVNIRFLRGAGLRLVIWLL